MDRDGKILEDHIVIILNEAQLKQVGTQRILVLTDKQHEYIKKICNIFPKEIWTVTPHYKLCACETIYGIWNRIDQIAIPLKVLESTCGYGQTFVQNHIKNIVSELKPIDSSDLTFWRPLVRNKSWSMTLTMDHKGNMYTLGRRITKPDFESIVFDSPIPKGDEKNRIFLSPPPSIDKETDNRINTMVDHIIKYASKKEIKVEIGFSL